MADDSFDSTEAYRAAFALFAASERLDGGMITELVQEYGAEDLLNGLLSVGTRLRQVIREHAVECNCGGDAWLEDELYRLAEGL